MRRAGHEISRLWESTARHVRHEERDRRDSHGTCSGASPQRRLGWTCPSHFFPEVVPEIDANPEHKNKLYTRALLLLRRPPTLEQTRLDTLVTTCATRTTRRSCRVLSRRDVTSQVEVGLITDFDISILGGYYTTDTLQR